MSTFFRMVLLVVASMTFIVGMAGALIFPSGDGDQTYQAHGASPASTDSQLSWETSMAAGSALAKKANKYVLADIYTSWCGWCKRLDRDVFTNAKLVSYLQKDFICVKVNAEEPKEGVGVAEANKVTGYPCGLVFSPAGKLIGRIDGYENPRGYMKLLKKFIRDAEKDPKSP
jgi:thioredoxin-related protein